MTNAQEWLDKNYPNINNNRSQVTELDISNKNLQGTLSGKGWINLHKQNFSFNQLNGGDLGNDNWDVMEELDWSYNKFGYIESTGTCYVWGVHSFPNLKKLNFSNNLVLHFFLLDS